MRDKKVSTYLSASTEVCCKIKSIICLLVHYNVHHCLRLCMFCVAQLKSVFLLMVCHCVCVLILFQNASTVAANFRFLFSFLFQYFEHLTIYTWGVVVPAEDEMCSMGFHLSITWCWSSRLCLHIFGKRPEICMQDASSAWNQSLNFSWGMTVCFTLEMILSMC